MGDKRRLGRIDEAHGGREEVRKTRKIGGVGERGGIHGDDDNVTLRHVDEDKRR